MSDTTTYYLVSKGLVGVHANGLHSWGGHRPAEVSTSGCRDRTIEEFVSHHTVAEGAWCVDSEAAILKHGASSVYRAPLPTITGDTDPGPSVEPGASLVADTVAAEAGNGFGALVRGARSGTVNLGSASLPDYAAYWRRLGARIGRVWAGVVEWEPRPAVPAPAPVPSQSPLDL